MTTITEPGALIEYAELEQGGETWRPIPGFEGDYEVSNLGRVRSYLAWGGSKTHKSIPSIKKPRIGSNGYLRVMLQQGRGRTNAYHVHALVAAAFLGPRPTGLEVAHRDGDRSNASLENLRYATKSENAQDRRSHGTYPIGEVNGNHKVTEAQVMQIRARYQSGERQSDIAHTFGISSSQVSNIVRNAAWSHVDSEAI